MKCEKNTQNSTFIIVHDFQNTETVMRVEHQVSVLCAGSEKLPSLISYLEDISILSMNFCYDNPHVQLTFNI